MNQLPKIVTVIQARMGSTRLPGKVFLPLADKPLLLRMYERVSFSKFKGEVVIAITISPANLENATRSYILKSSGLSASGKKTFPGRRVELIRAWTIVTILGSWFNECRKY